jgi:para-nitrobenzyl esterase
MVSGFVSTANRNLGGGYVFGDNRELGLYDASNIVDAHNYVHVAMNYRLSALGFLALPGLRAENPYTTTGNYALQDQQAVLRFVRNNIAAFGGDPTQVTIFGESAGAFSVCWHLVSPTSKSLFKAAIMESGNCESPAFYYPVEQAMVWGKEYAEAVGCDSATHNDKELVECLRALPLAKVLHGGVARFAPNNVDAAFYPLLYPLMPWGPAIDKTPYGLLDVPMNLIRAGRHSHVPVILGTNANEGNMFIPGLPVLVPGAWFPLNEARVKLALQHFFNDTTTDQVVQLYYESAADWESVTALILRDFFFACPARRVAASLSTSVPVHLYHFTFVAPNWVDQWLLGDYHSSELEVFPFSFNASHQI